MHYHLDWIESIGFLGGFCFAVSLLPQIIKSWTSQSTEDIAYGWQALYMAALALNFCYYFLKGAVAGWIGLLVETSFALFLLALKLRLDGCNRTSSSSSSKKKRRTTMWSDETIGDNYHNHNTTTIPFRNLDPENSTQQHYKPVPQRPSMNFPMIRRRDGFNKAAVDEGTIEITVQDDSSCSMSRHGVAGVEDAMLEEADNGCHFSFHLCLGQQIVSKDFGQQVMMTMVEITKRHGICSIGCMLEVFQVVQMGTTPAGFATAVLLKDGGHMSARYYQDESMLDVEYFPCQGSSPEDNRRVIDDMIGFVLENLGKQSALN